MSNTTDIGKDGEDIAEKLLSSKGFTTVARNYHTRMGEIDLIVKNKELIVFVEVKTRHNRGFGDAVAFVTASKRRKILTTAQVWLMQHKTALQPRFDVVEVYTGTNETVHIENAFGG